MKYAVINTYGKIAVPLSLIESVSSVEQIGDYDSRIYQNKGLPESCVIVDGKNLVVGNKAEEAAEEAATVRLGKVNKELEALKLTVAQNAAFARLVSEGADSDETRRYVDSLDYAYKANDASIEDVAKYIRITG